MPLFYKGAVMNNVLNNENDLTVTLENLMQDALESVNKVVLNSGDSLYPFSNLLKLFLAKVWHICDATLAILQRDGSLYPEAYSMTRVLLEYYISIQYINKIDQVRLSERFYRYSDVAGYRLRKNWSGSNSKIAKKFNEHPGSDKQEKEVERYLYDYGNSKQNLRHWSGKPVEQMANCIKERYLYDRVYRWQCLYVHPESLTMIQDLHRENDDIIIKREANQEHIDRILSTCINLFSSIYLICSGIFDLEKEEELNYINIKVVSLTDLKKIKTVLEHSICPYCGESSVVKIDENIVFFAGSDHEETYYAYSCTKDDCVEKFYISKALCDNQLDT
jgi:hypothetical protein